MQNFQNQQKLVAKHQELENGIILITAENNDDSYRVDYNQLDNINNSNGYAVQSNLRGSGKFGSR